MFGFSWTRGAQRDTEDYRNGYPGKSDNQQMNLNFKFYTNKLPSTPDGDYIDNIHNEWWGDYRRLEIHHGYIQWLFPIREQGLNWDAQELQLHEAEKLRKSSKAMKRILTSYKMMLDFYGMKLTNEEDGTIERAENWKERFQHLNRSYHNYLRITRILKCLGEFDLEHLKANFVKFVLYEGMVEGTLSNLIDSCVKYWIGVLKIDEDRDGMFDYYEKLLEEECEREKPKKKPTLEVDVPAKEKGQKGKKTSPHDGRAKVYKNEFSDEETYTLEYAINLIDSDTEENEEKGKKKATGGKSHKDHEVSDSNEELVTADKDSQEMRYWDSAETNVEHGSDEIKDDEVVGDENVTTPELEKKGEESETKGNPGSVNDEPFELNGSNGNVAEDKGKDRISIDEEKLGQPKTDKNDNSGDDKQCECDNVKNETSLVENEAIDSVLSKSDGTVGEATYTSKLNEEKMEAEDISTGNQEHSTADLSDGMKPVNTAICDENNETEAMETDS
ncbi:opioid growth factor receptor-like protein 1 isoform X2 [Mya arenaria]|nr:opioid growth factor receptor-like protein 1 isoform X2 [Mya arenaria]XP_052802416.1 opioid growth factor receptor-like protein 1 isoform X2 [Mya arenaria]XP_052802417.1 opioid growth factor receptor-like protein 1 isoform X2 [Mya arenaria]